LNEKQDTGYWILDTGCWINKRMIDMQKIYNDLPKKTLLRPDEVARFFGVSRGTIYRWIDFGLLEACKPTRGVIRIKRESIITLISND